MEENKRKEIEVRLFQLFAQNDQDKNENQLTKTYPAVSRLSGAARENRTGISPEKKHFRPKGPPSAGAIALPSRKTN